jgi:hypothetical protein
MKNVVCAIRKAASYKQIELSTCFLFLLRLTLLSSKRLECTKNDKLIVGWDVLRDNKASPAILLFILALNIIFLRLGPDLSRYSLTPSPGNNSATFLKRQWRLAYLCRPTLAQWQ